MKAKLHSMYAIPEGKSVGDLLPAFAAVKNEVHVGTPNQECAGCKKTFDAVRKPRKNVRMYHLGSALPICFSFRICGSCLAQHHAGGTARDAVLAAIQAFCEGDIAVN